MAFDIEEPLQPFMVNSRQSSLATTLQAGRCLFTTASLLSVALNGRKERRRSSAGKLFLGDHADLRNSPEVAKLMAKHGEPLVVLFSEEVLKINRRGEAVPRVMLLASNALYFLNAETHRMHRKLPLRSLGALRMSELSDNFLAIINPAEYDCLLVCARKTEAVVAVCEAHRAAVTALGMGGEARGGGGGERRGGEGGQGGDGGAELPVELSLRFTYKAGANVVKQVVFTRLDDGEVDTTISDAPCAPAQ